MSDHTEKTEEQITKEEIQTKIKELTSISDKFKSVAINFHLEKKKALDAELEKEMKELTLKYEKLSQPIYTEVNQIVTGQRGVKDEELTNAAEFLSDQELQQKEAQKENKEAIKGYWLKCLMNNDMIAPEIKEKDEAILEHLVNIEYVPNAEDSLKFEITFTFSQNEFFDNEKLTKNFTLKDDEEPKSSTGTEINWKEGKNVTVKTVKKTQKNKKSGAKRVVTKEVQDESFFNYFKDSEMVDEQDDVDEDDEEAMAAGEKIYIDFDVSRGLIDEIIPYSLEYFLGVKQPEDDEEHMHGDYDDEDGDDDDEDDEDAPKKSKKKPTKKSSHDSTKSNEGKKQEKPECKQQ